MASDAGAAVGRAAVRVRPNGHAPVSAGPTTVHAPALFQHAYSTALQEVTSERGGIRDGQTLMGAMGVGTSALEPATLLHVCLIRRDLLGSV